MDVCVYLYNVLKPVFCCEGYSVEHGFIIQSYLKPGILSIWGGNLPSRYTSAYLLIGSSGGCTVTMAASCNHGKS